eukprot:GHUV01043315.1.p1 GENE.GHUV01043315.1~~GHUV01043315.1.p1  ORF type:complete len:103 (+),score=16.36 GHUV01043315.1:328-636(+)
MSHAGPSDSTSHLARKSSITFGYVISLQAYDALPAGGAFIAIEMLIDDQRQQNIWGLTKSLDMLMEFESEGSFDFTFQVRGQMARYQYRQQPVPALIQHMFS